MTTERELYKAIGVADYEPLGCWRKEGVFHLGMSAPASCYRCPQCGNRDVIRRGQADSMVHAPRIGMDRTVLFSEWPTATKIKTTSSPNSTLSIWQSSLSSDNQVYNTRTSFHAEPVCCAGSCRFSEQSA